MRRREVIRSALPLAVAATQAGKLFAAAGADRAKMAQSAAASPLILRKIPSSGETLPVIGLGTSGPFEVGGTLAERAPLRAVLAALFTGGGRLIDTSPMYTTAEGVLGDLLSADMQQRAFIATKVWTRGKQAGIEQMQRSLQLLKRTRIDLMQVHNLQDLDVQLATARAWREQGRIRYIGVTHYTVAAHAELARVIERERLDFVQLNYSAATPDAERRLLPLAADRGVAVLVNRAFEDGELFTRLRGRSLPAWAADIDCASWAQLLLKYVIAHPAVTCVIPATGKVKNMIDNLGAGRGRLPDAALRRRIADAVRA